MPGKPPGKNVRWLASFPKSGNTWARIFVAHLFAGRPLTLAEFNLMPLYTDTLDPGHPDKVYIGKAHRAYYEPLHGTLPAIYILRDPVDIVPSAAKFFGVTNDRMSREIAKDWSRHIQSWWGHIGLLIKYEDMPAIFYILAEFLGQGHEQDKILMAIQNSDFKRLQADEAENGFVEASEKGGAFFRHGRPGNGREVLTDAQVQRVINGVGELYGKLGYGDQEEYTTETHKVPGSTDAFAEALKRNSKRG